MNIFSVLAITVMILILTRIAVQSWAAASVTPLEICQGNLGDSIGLTVNAGNLQLSFSMCDFAETGYVSWGARIFDWQSSRGHGSVVPVVQGWFNVVLGPVGVHGASIATAFAGTIQFVEIQHGTNAPSRPRQRILSALCALREDWAAHSQNAQSAETAAVATNIVNGVSAWALLAFAGSTPRSGYLSCDGSSVARAEYPSMFSAIGRAYGSGNVAGTLQLPNLRGRVPVGFDARQVEFDARGKVGGNKTHKLVKAEMPPRRHFAYLTGFGNKEPGNGQGIQGAWVPKNTEYMKDWLDRGPNNDGKNSQPFSILPPFVVVNYIIKR